MSRTPLTACLIEKFPFHSQPCRFLLSMELVGLRAQVVACSVTYLLVLKALRLIKIISFYPETKNL